MNTMVTVGWEDGGRGSEELGGSPGPASVWGWGDRLGTVALLKALELIWIIMVDNSGEVAVSLESEVIWGLIIAYWLLPMFTRLSSSGTPGVTVCSEKPSFAVRSREERRPGAPACRRRPVWTALTLICQLEFFDQVTRIK